MAAPAAYDRQAAGYDRRWAAYTRRSLSLLRPLIGERPGRVLDVGCGTGALPRLMARWGTHVDRYLGVDLSLEMLRRAGEGVVQAAAEALPLADASFDLVVSASSLHDWTDPGAGLREMRRVLVPGGRLLLLDWCADFASIRLMRGWLRMTGRPVAQVFAADGLRRALEAAGLTVSGVRRERISPAWGLMAAEAVRG